MKISMIVAMASNRAIGLNNELLWHLPEDFKHFKAVTMGKPIVMGRKTFESIGKPLPGRKNVVISRTKTLNIEGVDVVSSLDEAFEMCQNEPEVMVIGGATVYEQCLPLAHRLYVTWVDHVFEADAFFPAIDQDVWQQISCESHCADDRHAFDYSFITYQRG